MLSIIKALLKPSFESTRLVLSEALRKNRKWAALKLAKYHGREAEIIEFRAPTAQERETSWKQKSNNQNKVILKPRFVYCNNPPSDFI